MFKRNNLRIFLFLALIACNDDDDPGGNFAGAPTISNLTYDPTEIPIDPGQPTFRVTGSLHFTNARFGAAQLKISSPEGGDITVEVAQGNGITEGVISGDFEFLMPDHPVTYMFDIWLIDGSNRASNKLSGSIKVVVDDRMLYWKKILLQDASWQLNDVHWNNDQFLAVGNDGLILTSANGTTWTKHVSETDEDLYGVTSSGMQYVAVGSFGTIVTSNDGVDWTITSSTPTNKKLLSIAYSGDRWVAVGRDVEGDSAVIFTSTDGFTWDEQSFRKAHVELRSVSWSGSLFMAVGDETTDPCCRIKLCFCPVYYTLITSPNGIDWTDKSDISKFFGSLYDVVWDGSRFLIAGGHYVLATKDGSAISFNDDYYSTYVYLKAVNSNGQRYFGVGPAIGYEKDLVFSSSDGLHWSYISDQFGQLNIAPNTLTDIEWSGEKYVVTGPSGYLLVSPQ